MMELRELLDPLERLDLLVPLGPLDLRENRVQLDLLGRMGRLERMELWDPKVSKYIPLTLFVVGLSCCISPRQSRASKLNFD